MTCLLAAFVGSEFSDALTIIKVEPNSFGEWIHLPNQIVEGTQQVFSTSRGVFASVINSVASGTLFDAILSAIFSLIGSEMISVIIFILLCLVVVIAFWLFFANIYSVISRRIFILCKALETRIMGYVCTLWIECIVVLCIYCRWSD